MNKANAPPRVSHRLGRPVLPLQAKRVRLRAKNQLGWKASPPLSWCRVFSRSFSRWRTPSTIWQPLGTEWQSSEAYWGPCVSRARVKFSRVLPCTGVDAIQGVRSVSNRSHANHTMLPSIPASYFPAQKLSDLAASRRGGRGACRAAEGPVRCGAGSSASATD